MILEQVAKLDPCYDAEVLVVDNDPDGSGRDALGRLATERMRCVVEPTPGIAAARNRALDEARGRDVLLFLDDDGRPAPQWLERMLDRWRESGAAAVEGWVDTHYLGVVDPWIEAGRFFVRPRWDDGEERPAAASGNLLLDLRQLGNRRFATALGTGGGEDTLLTRGIVADGGRIVFCRDAVVIDLVALERINRRWVLLRALSHGNASGVIDLHLAKGGATWPKVAAKGLALLSAGTVRAVLGVARGNLNDQARGARAAMRGTGIALAAAGFSYREYTRDGGWRDRIVRTPEVLRKPARHVKALEKRTR